MANAFTIPVKSLTRGQFSRSGKYLKPSLPKGFNLPFPLLILLAGCLLATAIVRYRLIFFASSDIGGMESNVIYSIQRYMAGYPLYANPEIAPYSITQYSPFYYRVIAAFSYLAGIEPDDTLGIYRISRIISLIANVVYAFLLFALSRRFKFNTIVALAIAVLAFIVLPPQAYSRPDSIYNVLVIATLYTAIRAIQVDRTNQEAGWLAATVGAAALAIATKQSGIILPIILTSYYAFFCRQWFRAAIVGGSVGMVAMGLLISLMPEHDPILLYNNIVKGVNQGVDWSSFKINIIDHYFRTFGLYNAIGLPLGIWLLRQYKSDYRWLGWFVIVLFSFSVVTSLKWGSALNYFTEYVSLTGLVAATWVRRQVAIMHGWELSWSILGFSAVVWGVVPNMPNFNWPLATGADALSDRPYFQQKQVADYVTDSLNLKPTEAVFVTNYNYCYLNGLLYRNCLIPQQDMVATVMYPRKKLDYSAFDKQISQHGIRFLITRSNETGTLFPGLTVAHYKLRRRFPQFDVYESE